MVGTCKKHLEALEDENPLKEKVIFQAQRTIASRTGRSGANGPFLRFWLTLCDAEDVQKAVIDEDLL